MTHDVIALVVAGGIGERFSKILPKQYVELAGKPMLRRTVKFFLGHEGVDAVQVVIHPEHKKLYEEAIEGLELLPLVMGGKTRQESVRKGLANIIGYNPTYVLIHDAARPFVKAALVNELLDTLQSHEAVVPGIKLNDTIKKVEGDIVKDTVDRQGLWAVQTPQAFHFDLIYQAHQKMVGKEVTDDASLLELEGVPVKMIAGDPLNQKITTEQDMHMAQERVKHHHAVRVGMGTDIHAFCEPKSKKNNTIMLCGVEVPHTHSLAGHSDADIVLHAVVDALLGAIAKGDIGQHFPPTDDYWKNADSSVFIQHAKQLVEDAGGHIEHVDVTIIGERPKIADYREKMQNRLAELLQIPFHSVNIKATTTEKLGFLGRQEGLAAQAIATVQL